MSYACYMDHLNCFLKNCLNCFKYNFFQKIIVSILKKENSSYKILWDNSKDCLNCFKYNIFCFQTFSKKFLIIYMNGKSESQNSLKSLKIQLNCFHKFFKAFSWIYKNGKSELQNSLKSLKNYLNCFKYNMF